MSRFFIEALQKSVVDVTKNLDELIEREMGKKTESQSKEP
jgi:hypothetical protein